MMIKKLDFVPYSKSEIGEPVETLNEFKSVLSQQTHTSREIMGQTFIFAKLKGSDRLFPPDERDGYEVKDNIFEIRKLITKSP